MTETIRIIEVRNCGECPRGELFNFEEQCICMELVCEVDPNSIHPSCPLKSIAVPLSSLMEAWNKMHSDKVETGYNKEMLNDETDHR